MSSTALPYIKKHPFKTSVCGLSQQHCANFSNQILLLNGTCCSRKMLYHFCKH